MQLLEKLRLYLNRLLVAVAGFLLIAMVVLTTANIVMRLPFINSPISGTTELMGLFGAIVTSFALGYTQLRRDNIAVDILVDSFNPRVRKVLGVVNSALCMVFFAIVGWRIWIYADKLRFSGEVTETLRIAYYPVTYATSCGVFFLSAVFFIDILSVFVGQSNMQIVSQRGADEHKEGGN
jgi:TRAP-type C4-dicarboxylate transport system permease small subunit